MSNMTETLFNSLVTKFSGYASGQEIEVSFSNENLFVYGSELAIDRIVAQFNAIDLWVNNSWSQGIITDKNHPYYGAAYFLMEINLEGDFHSLHEKIETVEWFEVERLLETKYIVRIIEYKKNSGQSKQIQDVFEIDNRHWSIYDILDFYKDRTKRFDQKEKQFKSALKASNCFAD